MNVVKLGKKGRVSIPKTVMDRLGLREETMLLIDTTDDGAIMLRPASNYPIEIYSDERIQAFLEADELSPEQAARLEAELAGKDR